MKRSNDDGLMSHKNVGLDEGGFEVFANFHWIFQWFFMILNLIDWTTKASFCSLKKNLELSLNNYYPLKILQQYF